MNYTKVESSQIAEVGFGEGFYGPETLGVRFQPNRKQAAAGEPGSEYHYESCTPRMHRAMLKADDIYAYFSENIKKHPDSYPYVKIENAKKYEAPLFESSPIAGFAGDGNTQSPKTAPSITGTDGTDRDSPSTALTVIDTMADDLLFTPGAVTDAQLAAGREWYLAEAKKYDISTEKSRTELKRFARPLQKLRTGIEARAKELTGATKRKIAAIDAEKRRLVLLVGGIEDEVLRPLKDYEAAEESRIETRNVAIKEIQEAGPYTQAHWMDLPIEVMREHLVKIESDTREWPELGTTVDAYRKESIKLIKGAISAREEYEKGQAELAKLRAEAAERAEQDRMATVAKAAKEESENWYRAEIRRLEQVQLEAERDREAEVEAERKRVAAQAAVEQEAAEARAADEKHRNKVNYEAAASIVAECLIDEPAAHEVINAIAGGLIPHVSITY